MNKSEITVVIDSEEKKQRAIEILNKYKEHIWEEDYAMNFEPFKTQLVFTDGDWYICYDIDLNGEIEITFDQLDELLKNQELWDKLNEELDSVIGSEFDSKKFKHPEVFSENGNQLFFDEEGKLIKEEKLKSVFENSKSTLRKHLFDNKEKITRDLEQMREWSKTNEQSKHIPYTGKVWEPPKKETIDEAAERAIKSGLFKDKTLFIAGAKWQQERSYNEEEVLDLLYKRDLYLLNRDEEVELELPNDWFEKFKKK